MEPDRLTLDQVYTYEVVVPGPLGTDLSDWVGEDMTIEARDTDGGVTAIIGPFDQAALHGLLRRLYSVGFPLVSVRVIGADRGAGGTHENERVQ